MIVVDWKDFVSLVAVPALGLVFGLGLYAFRLAQSAKDDAAQVSKQAQHELAGFREQVAHTYATVTYLQQVETRMMHVLEKIDRRLDRLLDRVDRHDRQEDRHE